MKKLSRDDFVWKKDRLKSPAEQEGRGEGVEKSLWSDGNKCQNSGGRAVPERRGSWVGSSQAQMF